MQTMSIPVKGMTFHFGHTDPILVDGWVANSAAGMMQGNQTYIIKLSEVRSLLSPILRFLLHMRVCLLSGGHV